MPPPAAPLSPDELIARAHAVITSARFPFLATIDGDQPRLRPISPVRVDGFTIYVANLRSYAKTHESATNPKAGLCYIEPGRDQTRIVGVAEVLTDRAVLKEIWNANPLLRRYLGSVENPELII